METTTQTTQTTEAIWAQCDQFTRGYVEAALWSSSADDGTPLDQNHDWSSLSPDTLLAMKTDCEQFQRENRFSLAVYAAARKYGWRSGEELAGHDFWLTRNGHGTGFWDRFRREDIHTFNGQDTKPGALEWLGDRLAKRCGWRTKYPEVDLYVGDDGRVYAS
jgi:hypothetical protein